MLYNSDILLTFLARSKHIPLYITLDTSSTGDRLQPKLFHLLDAAAHRTRSLQLRCAGLCDDASTSRTWDAPLLETIDLSLSYSSTPADFAFLTGATLPNLKRLSLRSVHADLCTSLFRSTLVRLVIHESHGTRTSMQWAGLLEQMPLLEHLVLSDTMESSGSSEYIRASPLLRTVTMAHLSNVDFADSLECVRLLEYLVLPTLQTLTISVFDDQAIEGFCYAFSAISSTTSGKIGCLSSCSIRLDNDGILQVDLEPSKCSPGSTFSTPDTIHDTELAAIPSVRVRLGCDDVLSLYEEDHTDNLSDTVSTLVSTPLLSNIRTLSISNDYHSIECPMDLSVLSPLCLIEELTYADDNHIRLLDMLSKRTPDSIAPLMFPALTTLTLRRSVWQQFNLGCGHFPLLSEDIDDMLDMRKLLGVPLQELYLRELRNTRPVMGSIRSVIDDIRSVVDDSWLTTPRNDLRVLDWDGECTGLPFVMCLRCEMEGGHSDVDSDEDLGNSSGGDSEGS